MLYVYSASSTRSTASIIVIVMVLRGILVVNVFLQEPTTTEFNKQ